MPKLQIRVISPWFGELETEDAFFSVNLPTEKADALLCDWAPSDELITFPRRKAWYCCEPECQFFGLGGGSWPHIRDKLAPHEFLYHNHPDPQYRVPHVTHFEPLEMNADGTRLHRAIAIVSNHGGNPLMRHRDITYRNDFITHPQVELFGRSGWKRYRRRWYSRSGKPTNYQGEIPGDWPASGKRELMSRYRVAVCLENMNEPHYFTEKFVEAVCAGCVPVYRADPTVRDTVLIGAAWIDPADHGGDPVRTLRAALEAAPRPILEQNASWLRSEALAATSHQAVFEQIAAILRHQSASSRR
jgi:hypothetical protein